jgi:hypothetical protein
MQKAGFYIPFQSAGAISCANHFRNLPFMSLPRAAASQVLLFTGRFSEEYSHEARGQSGGRRRLGRISGLR